ncbi:hypothetical protein BZB76_2460 [Actinomadura pelletieri DSM 43383]|uniref:Small secreted protein n=1 Tax=Actinomadura pelletieri DSM 43383 TaxID=1120940 RepID=A0A495QUG2_9ACTN|nr:hypothetical protein [Actinomadura pelletieri]RKS77088.1 hypothetical protein BZB76_2460 [Actinomadura pelletieri DSM 43383]
MGHGGVRALAGGVVALFASGLLGGCGTLGGDSAQVCTDTKKAFQQYMTQVKSIPAAEPARWRQATEQLAGRLDALAKETDDEELKKALTAEAGQLRAAAPAVGTGDVAQLDTVMREAPTRVGKAC